MFYHYLCDMQYGRRMLRRIKTIFAGVTVSYFLLMVFGIVPTLTSLSNTWLMASSILKVGLMMSTGAEIIALIQKIGAFKLRKGKRFY